MKPKNDRYQEGYYMGARYAYSTNEARIKCLELAHDPFVTPEDVVARARTYEWYLLKLPEDVAQ